MKFHDFELTKPAAERAYPKARRVTTDAFFEALANAKTPYDKGDEARLNAMWHLSENRWLNARRPFYNVWPTVIPMLLRLDLDKVQCEWIKPIMPELLIKLPVENNPLALGPGNTVRNILACGIHASGDLPPTLAWSELLRRKWMVANRDGDQDYFGLFFAIDFGEVDGADTCMPMAMRTLQRFWLKPGTTVGEQEADLGWPALVKGEPIDDNAVRACVKLYCTLALLDNESDLIDAVVFNADRRKYDETGNEKYVEKAKRRGTIGWDVGRRVEVMPHYRRRHFAIRHMGPGGSIPRIRPIKDSIVHRKKLGDMPTGYADGGGP